MAAGFGDASVPQDWAGIKYRYSMEAYVPASASLGMSSQAFMPWVKAKDWADHPKATEGMAELNAARWIDPRLVDLNKKKCRLRKPRGKRH